MVRFRLDCLFLGSENQIFTCTNNSNTDLEPSRIVMCNSWRALKSVDASVVEKALFPRAIGLVQCF